MGLYLFNMVKIILASNSPRRRELLRGLDLDFEVKVLPGVDESYPEDLPVDNVSEYIAREKAAVYQVPDDEILITADTTVILGNEVLGKPADDNDARAMLRKLSGRTHHVVTGVCLTTSRKQRSFSVSTEVTFKELSDEEIRYYVSHYHPLDKAGAYGIQEWIGMVGVNRIDGCFYNVMGLPVARLYKELKKLRQA